VPSEWTKRDRYRFFAQVRFFFWEVPYLFKHCPDQIIRRCVPEEEHRSVLTFCHELACSGHFGPHKTAEKVLQSGFYWPTLFKDFFNFLQVIYKLPNDRKNYKKRHDAPKPYSGGLRFSMFGALILWDHS